MHEATLQKKLEDKKLPRKERCLENNHFCVLQKYCCLLELKKKLKIFIFYVHLRPKKEKEKKNFVFIAIILALKVERFIAKIYSRLKKKEIVPILHSFFFYSKYRKEI